MKLLAIYYILILILLSSVLNAQVTFIVSDLPESTPPEDIIYIAGTFNGWNPGDPNYELSVNDQENWEITLAAQSEGNSIEYKFTRGNWGTVEKGNVCSIYIMSMIRYVNAMPVKPPSMHTRPTMVVLFHELSFSGMSCPSGTMRCRFPA